LSQGEPDAHQGKAREADQQQRAAAHPLGPLTISNDRKEIRHSKLGPLEFDMMSLQGLANTDVKVIGYMAVPATTATLAQQLHSVSPR
jgi:hypothetical protein